MVKTKKMTKVVLVRLETSPEDIVGMQVSQGILTVRGGMTSHAAVVARGMGTCCVSGCGDNIVITRKPRPSRSTAASSRRATGSPSTAPPATSTASRSATTVAATINRRFRPLHEAGPTPCAS
jgi:pyruvate,orthophosphate dikinase